MRIDQGAEGTSRLQGRRVRHEVADGVRLMAFSLGSSVAIAVLVALLVGSL